MEVFLDANMTQDPGNVVLFSQAVALSNQAVQASQSGDLVTAERLHRQALELKLRTCGPEGARSATSMNGLGEALLHQGKIDEAEKVLREAVRIRSSKTPQSFDTAVSRENMAQVYEAKGDLQAAKAIRLEGKPNNLACSNYNVRIPFRTRRRVCTHI